MEFLLYLLCFLLSWVSLHHLLSHFSQRYRSLPPGPTPLPIVGNLFSLGAKPHISLARLAKIHGPVMSLQLGRLTTVVISSPSAAAKEVLQIHDASFSYRTIPAVAESHNHHNFSTLWLPPHATWRFLRKTTNSQLFSISRLDARSSLRKEKISELLSHLDACCQAGIAVHVAQLAFNTALNLLSTMFFSVDIVGHTSSSSVDGRELKEVLSKMVTDFGKPNYSDFFPLLKRLDVQGLRGKMDVYLDKWLALIDAMIHKRLISILAAGDVLDALINTSKENTEGFTRDFISHLLLDLFIAGSETTSSTLEWAMAELMHTPTKMKKLQQELEDVVGIGNIVKEEDISKLPYLQAMVKETFRLHPAIPFLVPRKAVTDVKISGFLVPKDSQVLINVWAIGKDTSIWEDADLFRPERFLGSSIDVKVQDFELTPFGGGRRICPGLPLALRMIPIMLVSLVHSFDWKLGDEVAPESMNMGKKFGFTLQKAQPLQIIPVPKACG